MSSSQSYSKYGNRTALATFIIATIVCALYLLTGNSFYFIMGYIAAVILIPSNVVILIALWVKALKVEHPKSIYRSMGLMLLNIPVCIMYFYVCLDSFLVVLP